MAISILLKTASCLTSIHSQSLVKILWRSDTDEITFKAIKKQRYDLRETVASELIRAEFYKKITIYTRFFNFSCFLFTNVTSAAPHIITSVCFCPKMPRTNVYCLTLSHLNVQLTLRWLRHNIGAFSCDKFSVITFSFLVRWLRNFAKNYRYHSAIVRNIPISLMVNISWEISA